MAFGRLKRPGSGEPIGDINMTPLIDVMLVLLVIFMVTAPLMSRSLKLDLPRSDAARPASVPAVLAVSLDAQGHLYLDGQRIEREALAAQATEAARRSAAAPAGSAPSTPAEVQLRADRAVPYGEVAELIGLLQKAGLQRIAFVADAPAGAAPAAAR